MKKILFAAACIMLAACGTKESNSANVVENVKEVSEPKEPEMTPEEETVAQKFGVVKAKDMGDGYFKVAKYMSVAELDSLVYEALGEGANPKDEMSLVWGVVDSSEWIVPAVYQTVERSLGNAAFVVSYTEWIHDWSGDYDYYTGDGRVESPWRYQQLFAVYYNGKIFAGWDTKDNFELVTYKGEPYGAMNKFDIDDVQYLTWYSLNNEPYNNYLYVESGSHPFYTSYEVKDGLLYMWNQNQGNTFAEAKNNKEMSQDEKSLLIFDLRKSKTLYDPFVPVD